MPRLPAPTAANTLGDHVYIAPRTPVEKRVVAILAELLALEKVGVDDNFFFLGGHSLLGTQLIARVRNSFDVELSLRTPSSIHLRLRNCPMRLSVCSPPSGRFPRTERCRSISALERCATAGKSEAPLSLYHLLSPEVRQARILFTRLRRKMPLCTGSPSCTPG